MFGRVDQNIKELEDRLEGLESQLQLNYSEDIESKCLISKVELKVWEKREEVRVAQIAKKKWLKEGDKNSKFFHVVVNQRRCSSTITQMVLEDGTVLSSPEAVHTSAVEYFRGFLSEDTETKVPDLHALLTSEVSLLENDKLCRLPTKEKCMQQYFPFATKQLGS